MGEHQELISTEVNGASLTDIEYDEIISSKKDTAVIQKYNDERNDQIGINEKARTRFGN